MKASFSRILGINLAIILGVTVALRLVSSPEEIDGVVLVFRLAIVIVAQFSINSILGLTARLENVRQSFLTAALITFLIGFGACYGAVAIP